MCDYFFSKHPQIEEFSTGWLHGFLFKVLCCWRLVPQTAMYPFPSNQNTSDSCELPNMLTMPQRLRATQPMFVFVLVFVFLLKSMDLALLIPNGELKTEKGLTSLPSFYICLLCFKLGVTYSLLHSNTHINCIDWLYNHPMVWLREKFFVCFCFCFLRQGFFV